MQEFLFVEPYLKEVIWGGTRLRDEYGYETKSRHIGEAWVISATEPGYSIVKNGLYKGKNLKELWDEHRELFGNLPGDDFPLLVKLMDASDNLSIQVHPDDALAHELESFPRGKAECWYILDAAEGTDIVLGHNAANTAQLKSLIDERRWDELLRVLPLHKGDFLYNPPGSVHAIRKGSLILEIQQNSDITYRLYDYDRLQNGKKRPLHIEKSLRCITCPQTNFLITAEDAATYEACDSTYLHRHLISCSFFTADLWKKAPAADKDAALTLPQTAPFLLVCVTRGNGLVNDTPVKAGDNFIATSGCRALTFSGDLEFVTAHV